MPAMNGKERKRLQANVEALSARMPRKASSALEPSFVIRVLERLSSFAPTCETCQKECMDVAEQIHKLREGSESEPLSSGELRPLQKRMDLAVSHLQKRHKMLVEGQARSTYLAIGLSLGMVFGLALFDNIGIGMAIGVAIGVGVGSGIDAKAKKEDRLI